MRKQVAASLESIYRSTHGRNRTCISGALRKADELTVARQVEIVLVSDMLEDCDTLLRSRCGFKRCP